MLDDIDFMDGISQHEYILVNFYAPMCGHYRRMKSSYQKLADNLASKNSTIKLALFDINGNKHIPAAFDIKDLPDLKFFSNKVMMEYTGG